MTMRLSDFLTGVGRPIAYYPGLRKITGSTNATIFLCQFVYWTGKERGGDGWIYKTSEGIEEETGLSYKEQAAAREKLITADLIEEKYARLEHQMYFRVKLETLNEKWGNTQAETPELTDGEMGKLPLGSSLNGTSETTTKTTLKGIEQAIFQDRAVTQEDINASSPKYKQLCERIEKLLKVTPNMGNPKWETVLNGIEKREKQGQSLDDYARWCREDKFNSPKTHQIAKDPHCILDTWVAAFDYPAEAVPKMRVYTAKDFE